MTTRKSTLKNNTIKEQKLQKYFEITTKALRIAKAAQKNPLYTNEAIIILDMANSYLSDADYFRKKGDYVLAFGAINYAHGWLDAGARLGFYIVKDSKLFTVDD